MKIGVTSGDRGTHTVRTARADADRPVAPTPSRARRVSGQSIGPVDRASRSGQSIGSGFEVGSA